MSWFGFGSSGDGSSDNNNSSSSFDAPLGGGNGSFSDSQPFGDSVDMGGGLASGGSGSSAMAGLDIRSQLMAERQKAELQAVIGVLTELAFEQCVSKPGSSLGSGERSCIEAVVGKYLDTNEFVLMRMTRGNKS